MTRSPQRPPAAKCPRCEHKQHDEECTRRGPVTCRRVSVGPMTVQMRGQWPCDCPGDAPAAADDQAAAGSPPGPAVP